MSFERYRCPACDHISVIFDGKPFACQNESCGADAVALRESREVTTREAFMRPNAVVYYLALGNRVKIGTTTDLPGRMKAVPHEELLAFEFGSYDVERTRHAQFAHARATGEWFLRDDGKLSAWIDSLRAGIEDLTDVSRSASRAVKRRILGLEAA